MTRNPRSRARRHLRRNFLRWSAIAVGGVAAVSAVGLPGRAEAAPPPASAVATPRFDPLRAPAVPLAVRSSYLSTWLEADSLPGTWPSFWTGHITAMTGLIRIDGASYVFMGNPAVPPVPDP